MTIKYKTGFLYTLLTLLLCMVELNVSADEIKKWKSGQCEVTLEDGILQVWKTSEGSRMADYENGENTPWAQENYETVVAKVGVTYIGKRAFQNAQMEKVMLASVEEIGDSAFYNCSQLTTVQQSVGLKTIKPYAFAGCSKLTALTLPSGLTQMDGYAFEGCIQLANVYCYADVDKLSWDNAERGFMLYQGTSFHVIDVQKWVEKYHITAHVIVKFGEVSPTASGTCGADGENLLWAFYENKYLTIRGSGNMKDYDAQNRAPWDGFYYDIRYIDVRDGVTSIGNYAFSKCVGAGFITLPEGLTTIGEGAFHFCKSITDITIPASVTTIGKEAFSECENLKFLSYAENSQLTEIPVSMCFECKCLATVQIPANVTRIGDEAFSYCGFTDVVFAADSRLRSIGKEAFHSQNLEHIVLPSTVEHIDDKAFYQCAELKTVFMLAPHDGSKPTIGQDVFSAIPSEFKIYVPSTSEDNYKANWAAYASRIESYPSGPCGDEVNWVISGDTLTIIGTGTMFNYNNSNNVAPWYAYRERIQSVNIVEGVTSIGTYAFLNCNALKTVSIGNTVTTIGSSAFRNCASLPAITLPNGVTTIGTAIFAGCNDLIRISMSEGGATYEAGGNAIIETSTHTLVAGCRSTLIPPGVTAIGASAFAALSSMASIALPNGLQTIGQGAFADCSGLTSINIPASVTSIDGNPFAGCWNIGTMTVDEGNTTYNSRSDCNAIIAKASGVLIAGCKNTIIPDSVTSIGAMAFYGCNLLPDIIIPEEVTAIGDSAFAHCKKLTDVFMLPIYKDSKPTLGESAFADTAGGFTIYVYESCAEAYQAASDWAPYAQNIRPFAAGYCGNATANEGRNLTWILIGHELTIAGKGDMANYSRYREAPWASVKSSIETVFITDGVKSVGSYAFNNITSLKNAYLAESVTTINKAAFNGCIGLESFIIHKKMTHIRANAFLGCINISDVYAYNNVADLVWECDNGDFKPDKGTRLHAIDKAAWENKYGTTLNATIQEAGVVGQGDSYLCTWKLYSHGLMEINAKAGTGGQMEDYHSVDEAPWYQYREIIYAVAANEGVSTIGRYAFFNCFNLMYVSLPSSLKEIFPNAFLLSTNLTAIQIPEGVETISYRSFAGCERLASVSLPSTLTTIFSEAFIACRALRTVISMSVTPPTIIESSFYQPENKTLYVISSDSKELYQTTDYWKNFGRILSIGADQITIGSTGYATYCSTEDLDFTAVEGLKAYIVSAYTPGTNTVTLTRINDVRAYTGIVLKGTPRSVFDVPFESAQTVTANMLKGVVVPTTLKKTDGNYTNYVLGSKSGNTGFYAVVDGSTLDANKAYLPLPTSILPAESAASRLNIVFDDEESDATSIHEITGTRKEEPPRATYYNLNGQRVEKPAKGLYIRNGKKVVKR